MHEKIMSQIQNLEPEAVELMKNLIAINAVGPKNGGPGEQEKAEYLKKYLTGIGITDIREYPAQDTQVPSGQRPNFTARIPGMNKDRTLWIITHMDVVPAGDLTKWSSDPFKAEVRDGRIYGRGSEDNHQGLVSAVICARAFVETGITPEHNIGLMFVSDEETGSGFGLEHIVKHHNQLLKEDDIIIIPDAGESDGSMIEVAEKSILWLQIKTTGKQVHASIPDKGINAFKAASHFAVRLGKLYDIYNAEDKLFDPPVSTFEPTKKEANVPNINTIPGDDVFCLDCRVLPRYSLGEVLETIRGLADEIENEYKVKIDYSREQYEQAAPATDRDAPVVRMLEKAVDNVYGIKARPMGIGGGTVASFLRKKGFQVAVWSTIDDLAHQPDEYCRISNLMRDARVFALCALDSETVTSS
jgi:succinyl-diaminopimelate desuccinylase